MDYYYCSIGYAYQGDIEAIKQTIEMMRGHRIFVRHNMYIDMLDAMSRGGHPDKITEVLLYNYYCIM